MSEAIKEAEKILKQYYGYDHFRETDPGDQSGTYDGRNYNRDLAADLTYERSGGNAEPDGSPCRFLK